METTSLNLRDQKLATGEINRLRSAFPNFHEYGLRIEQQRALQDSIRRTRRQVQDAERDVAMHETVVSRERSRLEALTRKQQQAEDQEIREGGLDREKHQIEEYEAEKKKIETQLADIEAKYTKSWEDYDKYCISLSKLRDKELQEERNRIAREKFVNHHAAIFFYLVLFLFHYSLSFT